RASRPLDRSAGFEPAFLLSARGFEPRAPAAHDTSSPPRAPSTTARAAPAPCAERHGRRRWAKRGPPWPTPRPRHREWAGSRFGRAKDVVILDDSEVSAGRREARRCAWFTSRGTRVPSIWVRLAHEIERTVRTKRREECGDVGDSPERSSA